MALQGKTVAIIGGGPGGLTLANLLLKKKVNVKVYERDANRFSRIQGSSLDLHHTSGLAALKEIDLIDAFMQNYLPDADYLVITGPDGIPQFIPPSGAEYGDEHFRPEISRGKLRDILLEPLLQQKDIIRWNSHCIGLEPHENGWLIQLKNQEPLILNDNTSKNNDITTEYADIVIGADGVNSIVRPYITPIKSNYTGMLMLEGDVETPITELTSLIHGGRAMVFGNGKNILIGHKDATTVGYYLSFPVNDWQTTCKEINFTEKSAVLQWFDQFYGPTWSGNPLWHSLIESTTFPMIPRPIYAMPVDQTWESRANVTIIGDAAHVMPPFAGEGVNMAMLDALELYRCFFPENNDAPVNLLEAIASFETNMRSRAAIVAQQSIDNGVKMHASDSLETMIAFFKSFEQEQV